MVAHERAAEWLARPTGLSEWALSLVLLGAGSLLLGALVAWLLRRLAVPLARRAPEGVHAHLVRMLGMPVGVTIALVGLAAAAREALARPEQSLVTDRLLPSALLILWGVALARILAVSLKEHVRHPHSRGALLMIRFVGVFVAVAVVTALLTLWDVDVTPLLASAGLVGIALALAAQETLANLFSGMALYLDRVYEMGDVVVLDKGEKSEIRGEVVDVGLRSTRILTLDDDEVVVPNSLVAAGRIYNESAHPHRHRIHLRLLVPYGSDLARIEALLLRVASQDDRILREPAAWVDVHDFCPSGVQLELLAFLAKPRLRRRVLGDLRWRVHEAFLEEGLAFALPQHDVHLVTHAGLPVHGSGAPPDRR